MAATCAWTWSGFISVPRKALLCHYLGSCDQQAIILQYFRMRSESFSLLRRPASFSTPALEMTALWAFTWINDHVAEPPRCPDRHQVRNDPVTLAGQLKKRTKNEERNHPRAPGGQNISVYYVCKGYKERDCVCVLAEQTELTEDSCWMC